MGHAQVGHIPTAQEVPRVKSALLEHLARKAKIFVNHASKEAHHRRTGPNLVLYAKKALMLLGTGILRALLALWGPIQIKQGRHCAYFACQIIPLFLLEARTVSWLAEMVGKT